MEKYRIDVSKSAENDLRDIVRYISAQLAAPEPALKMIETIEEAIIDLADIPRKYPLLQDERLSIMGYRKLIVQNYIVFYTIDACDEFVLILKKKHFRSKMKVSR